MKEHYVYFHFLPDTDIVFYVGIGKNDRFKSKDARNSHWKSIVNKYNGFDVKIIHNDLSIEEAHELEIKYIAQFGRVGYDVNGILCNKAIGGQGNKGFKRYSKMMTVLCFDKQANCVGRYESIESTKEFGFDPTCVRFCLTGKLKTYKSYIWIKESDFSFEKLNKLILDSNVLRKINPEKTSENCKKGQLKSAKEGKKRTNPILAYDKTGNIIGEFFSCGEAGRYFGYSSSFIKSIADGIKKKTATGLTFKFKKDVHN